MPAIRTILAPRPLLCATLLCAAGCGDAPTKHDEPLPGRIMFSRTTQVREGERSHAFVTELDGSEPRQLTSESEGVSSPAISPNGRRFAYVRFVQGVEAIVVRGMDGREENAFTPNTGSCIATLSWAPDGERLAFYTGCGESNVWVVNRDGSGLKMLGPGILPAWSRDGSMITFSLTIDGVNSRIGLMRADGTERTLIPAPSGSDGASAWSPDGSQLVFVHNESATLEQQQRSLEIWVMRPDGSGRRRLIGNGGNLDILPTWSPDGQYVAFARVPEIGNWRGARIFVVRADGSALRQVTPGSTSTTSETGDEFPTWAVEISP
jgi:TolB protein